MSIKPARAVPALLLFLTVFASADIKPPDVAAHGGDQGNGEEGFWVAQVTQLPTAPKTFQTLVYYRVAGQQDKWQVLARIPARVVSLTNRGTQAAALLEDGQWMLLFTDSTPYTTGPLPAPARMIALAGGRDAWWAVGVVPGGISSVPATSPVTATTRPASAAPATQPAQTRTAAARLVLFSLTANDWKPIAELPDDLPAASAASISVINESPYVASLDAVGVLHVRHLSGNSWVDDAKQIKVPAVVQFRLLSHSQLARLWVESGAGPDQVYAFGPKPSAPIQLQPIAGSAPTSRTVAFFSGAIRMVATDANGNLVEQDFDAATGKPTDSVAPLKLPQIGPMNQLHQLQWIVVTVALAIAVFGSFRQRASLRGTPLKPEEVPVAPYGRRLAAGLIDASPLVLAMGAVLAHYRSASAASQSNAEVMILVVYWAAAFFYVIYTTALEATLGRSVGKILLGLRIVSIDGLPPEKQALITRNVLRLIDVGVFFGPLVMILLFPLRQRAGDVAAGTVVIYGELRRKDDEESESAVEQPAQTQE